MDRLHADRFVGADRCRAIMLMRGADNASRRIE